ncbi:MAG: YdcF family protein [Prosthecobacter sp.]
MTSLLKSLVDLLEPIGIVWLMLLALAILHLRRRQWRLLALSGGGWVLLTCASVLPFPHLLLASLEDDWPAVDLATMPVCDAIVVLGGGMEPSTLELQRISCKDGADRVFTGLALAREGKGKLMLMGGGVFRNTDGREVYEADGVRDWLQAWQLAPAMVPIQSLGGCADTHDEAVRVAALVKQHGWERVALVTSAFHMTRSKAVFEKAGVPVLPVPCNFFSAPLRGRPLHWLNVPNASYLQHFETWMHEVVGMVAYRLRGWI